MQVYTHTYIRSWNIRVCVYIQLFMFLFMRMLMYFVLRVVRPMVSPTFIHMIMSMRKESSGVRNVTPIARSCLCIWFGYAYAYAKAYDSGCFCRMCLHIVIVVLHTNMIAVKLMMYYYG